MADDVAAEGVATEDVAPAERFRRMGEIAWLLRHAPPYDRADLELVEALFFRPLALGQLRLWRRGDRPVALGTWAWLDAPTARRHVETGEPLAPDAWRCGETLWFIDVIAPFRDGRAVARELTRLIPPGRQGYGVRRGVNGAARRVARYPSPHGR